MLAIMIPALATGCRKPEPQAPAGNEAPLPADGDFGSDDWDEMTGALQSAGRAGNVDEFKARLSPVTIETFEAGWARVIAKIDVALAMPGLGVQDRTALENLEHGCSWEAMAKGYRPGRLLAINPADEGRYRVTEIMQRNSRKLEYLVEKKDRVWVIRFEADNRWVKDLEDFLIAAIDKIILRSGGIPEQAAPAQGESLPDAA